MLSLMKAVRDYLCSSRIVLLVSCLYLCVYGVKAQDSIRVVSSHVSNSSANIAMINPRCFVSFDKGSNRFTIYTRDESKQNLYYGFHVELQSSLGKPYHEIDFSHLWRTTNGFLFEYQDGIMTRKEQILLGVENEFTYLENGKADHTGGVHGDERIDVETGTGITFYIDGIPLTETDLSASFELFACNSFHYLQKSTLHETATARANVATNVPATGDGVVTISETNEIIIDETATGIFAYNQSAVYTASQITLSRTIDNKWQVDNRIYFPVTGHPIVAEHVKRTEINHHGYKTWNRVKFRTAQDISQLFTGIACIHKNSARFVNNESYVSVEMTGSNGSFLTSVENRLYEGYNPATKLSSRVKSRLLKATNGYLDEHCEMHVWDRPNDSKYYRKVKNSTVDVGDVIETEMIVKFNKKD